MWFNYPLGSNPATEPCPDRKAPSALLPHADGMAVRKGAGAQAGTGNYRSGRGRRARRGGEKHMEAMEITVVAAVIERDGRILIGQRRRGSKHSSSGSFRAAR